MLKALENHAKGLSNATGLGNACVCKSARFHSSPDACWRSQTHSMQAEAPSPGGGDDGGVEASVAGYGHREGNEPASVSQHVVGEGLREQQHRNTTQDTMQPRQPSKLLSNSPTLMLMSLAAI